MALPTYTGNEKHSAWTRDRLDNIKFSLLHKLIFIQHVLVRADVGAEEKKTHNVDVTQG